MVFSRPASPYLTTEGRSFTIVSLQVYDGVAFKSAEARTAAWPHRIRGCGRGWRTALVRNQFCRALRAEPQNPRKNRQRRRETVPQGRVVPEGAGGSTSGRAAARCCTTLRALCGLLPTAEDPG